MLIFGLPRIKCQGETQRESCVDLVVVSLTAMHVCISGVYLCWISLSVSVICLTKVFDGVMQLKRRITQLVENTLRKTPQ